MRLDGCQSPCAHCEGSAASRGATRRISGARTASKSRWPAAPGQVSGQGGPRAGQPAHLGERVGGTDDLAGVHQHRSRAGRPVEALRGQVQAGQRRAGRVGVTEAGVRRPADRLPVQVDAVRDLVSLVAKIPAPQHGPEPVNPVIVRHAEHGRDGLGAGAQVIGESVLGRELCGRPDAEVVPLDEDGRVAVPDQRGGGHRARAAPDHHGLAAQAAGVAHGPRCRAARRPSAGASRVRPAHGPCRGRRAGRWSSPRQPPYAGITRTGSDGRWREEPPSQPGQPGSRACSLHLNVTQCPVRSRSPWSADRAAGARLAIRIQPARCAGEPAIAADVPACCWPAWFWDRMVMPDGLARNRRRGTGNLMRY